jgi:hypothetical protein
LPRLSHLLTLTPRETWRLVRRRLPGLRSGPAWTAAELMASAKHSRGIRFAELLLRQEAVVRRHRPSWAPLDFAGKRVVEVGCGPLAGFGPLAIFCGAARFESADPEWDPALFFSGQVLDKYLRVLHADLLALYGPKLTFTAFEDALHHRLKIATDIFDSAPIEGPVDIVLSQSVLEHVFPISAVLAKLAAIQRPATRFLHLVDFGNHYPTESPFEGLYELPADAYIAKRGKAINCLRINDMVRAFAEHGIAAETLPARQVRDSYRGQIHSWWRQRYDDTALFTQLALVASPS